MTKNPYRADLERQFAKARSKVVALRAEMASLRARELAHTEREMAELRDKLGLPQPTGPIKIRVTDADRAALARQRARAAAKAAPPPVRKVGAYMTKDMSRYLRED
jgi:hypothetical protein